ncbi:Ras family protein [Entamoeba marina]
MSSEYDEEVNQIEEVKIIFVGVDKNETQPIIDNFIQATPSAPTSESMNKDDTKPYIIEVKGQKVKLTLTCTDGKDKYRSLTTTFFKNATVIFLTYSLQHSDSVRSLLSWSKEVQRYCDPDVIVNTVGLGKSNPTDLEAEVFEEGKKFALENAMTHEILDPSDKESCIAFIQKYIDENVTANEPEKTQTKKGRWMLLCNVILFSFLFFFAVACCF